jgi:hypothetical protein
MNYWRINTDREARKELRTCDLWYKFGMAFTGDFEENKLKHSAVFSKLSPGDGVFMHHSGLGLVGYGIVKDKWNGEIYHGTERLLYEREVYEYRIAVDWDNDCDCREDPLPIAGRLPSMGTYSRVDPGKWDVHSVLQDLRKRASPIKGAIGEVSKTIFRRNSRRLPHSGAAKEVVTKKSSQGDSNMSINIDELEFEPIEDENDSSETPLSIRKIFSDQGDPEIDGLFGKYKRGKLVTQPDFQRYFVWDKTKCGRLIESALLDIPLPIIYLSEENDGKEYVIDGQQRLTAFFSFMDGIFPLDSRDFKLTGLKVFPELNNKLFKEMDEQVQDKIRYYKIRTITFRKESDPNLKFEIFERLNTGAVSLNDQELRNCIYRGPYNDLLKDLANDNDFRYLLGLDRPEKRMKDVELVLRWAAFYINSYLNYKPPVKSFLNNNMIEYQYIKSDKANELRKSFKNAVMIIRSLLDKQSFKRFYKGNEKNPNGYWEPKQFNYSLYDILMWVFSREDKNIIYQNMDSIREELIYLMTNDKDFIDSIELSTSSVQAVKTRFRKFEVAMENVIGIAQREPRCFSLKLKQEYYDNDPTCSICNQRIHNIDDSALDHIEQYWVGGKTIPENARLTHRYCNWARARKG